MIEVRRLAHATFETPDLEAQLAYYTEVIGIREREGDRAFLATKLGEEAITLVRGTAARFTQLAFQVDPGSDLNELAGKLQPLAIKSERRSQISPGVREAICFTIRRGRCSKSTPITNSRPRTVKSSASCRSSSGMWRIV